MHGIASCRRWARWLRDHARFVIVTGGLATQLAVLLSTAGREYAQFNLSFDFGIFHQAWQQIATGTLDPQITLLGYPYAESHLELIMWPLSVLYWFNRNDGLTLLWITALAIVATEAIALRWVVAAARRRRLAPAVVTSLTFAALLLFLANPWPYRAAVEDFHLQALGTCFAMAAGYDLWSGRTRRCWVWVVLALGCGDVAGTYIAGIGLGVALVEVERRRAAVALIATGLGWVAIVAALGANRGSALSGYAYLAGTTTLEPGIGSALSVAKGMISHPGRPIAELHRDWPLIHDNLAPTGWLGLLNPWVGGVLVLVLLENALNDAPAFITPGFQNLPIALFGVTGTALAVIGLASRFPRHRWYVGGVALAVTIAALAFDFTNHDELHPFRIGSAAASQLDAVRSATPSDAEVIATFGVVGRFAGRDSIFAIHRPGMTIPISSRRVIFVLAPRLGNQPVPPPIIASTSRYVAEELGARPIIEGPEVWAYEWRPGPNRRTVTLPTT